MNARPSADFFCRCGCWPTSTFLFSGIVVHEIRERTSLQAFPDASAISLATAKGTAPCAASTASEDGETDLFLLGCAFTRRGHGRSGRRTTSPPDRPKGGRAEFASSSAGRWLESKRKIET